MLLEIIRKGECRQNPVDNTRKEMFNRIPRVLESIHVFADPRTGNPYKSVKCSFCTALKRACISRFCTVSHCAPVAQMDRATVS